jgi:hypothetical protein
MSLMETSSPTPGRYKTNSLIENMYFQIRDLNTRRQCGDKLIFTNGTYLITVT